MTPGEAARVLGVAPGTPWPEVRLAYRRLIRVHHPDRAGDHAAGRAGRINEAYRVLGAQMNRHEGSGPGASDASGGDRPPSPPRAGSESAAFTATPRQPHGRSSLVSRLDAETVAMSLPVDEAFVAVLEAAGDVGDVTYLDRSMPILEALCRFEGEPATSLLCTFQGRSTGTEVTCSVTSIEDRPAPPAAAVVDLLELALHRRSAWW